MIGTTLAHYRITAALGAGGMGEVWRAEDTKLGREVALKILPDGFADDPDRHARFEREAKMLASLNHPNIATLHGLEHAEPSVASTDSGLRAQGPGPTDPSTRPSVSLRMDDADRVVHFLVMELVAGEDLSDRIARGPIPVDEAIPIALQIAEALEAAHEQGIVHRDLKPANIKITEGGTVKVLDFGLAKAWEMDGGDSSLSLSPTITQANTAAGVILGTAAYMSPEQARGKKVDRRADIWAFGVVLWEMLTGEKLFGGETVSDVMAAVLRAEPDWDRLPSDVPKRLRHLLGRCLERSPLQRLQAIGEARIALAERELPLDLEPSTAADTRPLERRSLLAWTVTGACAATALVLGVLLLNRSDLEKRVLRFDVAPPHGASFHLDPDNPGPVAVSPDGRSLVFSARDPDGAVRLYVRPLEESEARALPGTDGAQYPFWSPDSRRIGFFSAGKLRVVEISGGPPVALCNAQDGKGGTWSSDGTIVFAPSYNTPIHKVPAGGGVSTPVTEFDADRKDNSHRHPRLMPDGRHFLYMARSGTGSEEGHAVVIGSLDDPTEKTVLMYSPAAVEIASGHLLFPRDRTLMARPFDAESLQFTGDAFPVAENVTLLAPGTVIGVFSVSQDGILAYQEGGSSQTMHLVWRDRQGQELEALGEPDEYDEVHLSPDGEYAATAVTDPVRGTSDLWLFEIARNLRTKFTFDQGHESSMAYTPDGRSLIYTLGRGGHYSIHRKEIGGSGEGRVLLESDIDMYPSDVSPDGELLAFYRGGEFTNWDLWILPLSGNGEPYPLMQSDFVERVGMFSPDGQWLAYESDESGRSEIYVVPFPGLERKWQISTGGGAWPRWRSDGEEIIYHGADGTLMAVEVEYRDGGLSLAATNPLFNTGIHPGSEHIWAMSPDGDRVLVVESVSGADDPRIRVVVNWPEALGSR